MITLCDKGREVCLEFGQVRRFTVRTNAAPAFADVTRGPLRLLLSGPTSSGARATPADAAGDPVSGPGGRQVLLADPAGNLVELFQSSAGAAGAGQRQPAEK